MKFWTHTESRVLQVTKPNIQNWLSVWGRTWSRGNMNITGWKAGDLFDGDKVLGQIVNCCPLEGRPNADWGCSIRGSIRRKTQNVGIGWHFLAVFSKVLEERNVLFSLLKLVACRDGGKADEQSSFYHFFYCDIGHTWTRVHKIYLYSWKNIF